MIIRISLVVVLILIGIFLYTIGKEHKMLIDNRDITVGDIAYRAGTTYNIWVDNQEIGMIKKGERIKVMVTGVSHKIVVEEIKDKVLSGKKYEKMFKLKVNEDIVINIQAMINDLNEWINKTN
jgi:hypothetical protein